MNKTDKKAIIAKSTSKVNPPNVKVLPFDDGSKKGTVRKKQ